MPSNSPCQWCGSSDHPERYLVLEQFDNPGEWGIHGPACDGHDHVYPMMRGFMSRRHAEHAAEMLMYRERRADRTYG